MKLTERIRKSMKSRSFALAAMFAIAFAPISHGVQLSQTAQLVFPGATLDDLATHTLCARMGGDWFDDKGVETTFFNRVETVENGVLTKVTYQLQAIDGSAVKASKVEFTADASGVYAKLADGNYSNYSGDGTTLSKFGTDPLTDNEGTGHYYPYDLKLVAPANAISVNFTHSGANLNTTSSVRYGAGEFAVPYSSWGNMPANNNQTATIGGATVTITGTRGSWQASNLSSSKDLRRGYIDDHDSYTTPTVTVTDIPYAFYRVVAYASTDTDGMAFGYITINGTNYTGTTDATVQGTANWGSAGGNNMAKGLREGVNYLVSEVMSGSTATITGHRVKSGSTLTARSCLAAIQIVEYVYTYTATIDDGGSKTLSTLSWDNALPSPLAPGHKIVVNVNEDTTLDIDSALSVSYVEFNVASGKTLTLTGNNIAATAIYVKGGGSVVAGSASQLAGTLRGDGTLVYGASPSGITLADSAWEGVLWIKNCAIAGLVPADMASANSTLRLTGVTGYFNSGNNTSTCAGTLELVDDGATAAFVVDNGWSASGITVFEKLKGDGTLGASSRDISQRYVFKDASEFSGTINCERTDDPGYIFLRVIIGNDTSLNPSAGTITIATGASATIAADKTWTANSMVLNGTLNLGSGANAPKVASGTGAIAVTSGTGTVNGFDSSAVLTFSTTSETTLAIVDNTLTAMTIGELNNLGTLDLSATALTTATVNLPATVTSVGTIQYPATLTELVAVPSDQSVRSLSGYTVPSGLPQGAEYLVAVVENREEYGKGSLVVSDVPAGAKVRVTRVDATTTDLTPADGTATLTSTPQIAGAATMFDVTFKNNSADAGKKTGGTFTYKSVESAALKYDSNATFNNDAWDDSTGVYLKHHPYIDSAYSQFLALGDFSAVVVGTMSPTHETQFIHFGSSGATGNNGVLIATTENDNEVLIAMNDGSSVDVAGGVKVSVPNAATARHAYVVVRTGSTFAVWVDGVKRGSFTVPSTFTLGGTNSGSAHSGIQVGSDFGGAISRNHVYNNVAVNDSETGVVNVIRVFDYAISDAQAEAVFNAYPYVSQGGLYTRTVAADGTFSEAGAWAKDGAEGTFAVPEGATVDDVVYNPSATLTVNAAADIEANADVTIETLTVGGGAALTFTADGTHAVTVLGAALFNSPVTIGRGAVSLVGTPVQIGSSGSLAFDFSDMDISNIFTATTNQLTGLIERDDTKVTLIAPTAIDRTASLHYNETGSCYEFVVTPDREPGTIYYKSGEYSASSADLAVVRVAENVETTTVIFPGDTVVFSDGVAGANAVVTFGAALPANAAATSFSEWTGTVLLPAFTSGANLNNYGIAGSTVRVLSASGAWAVNNTVAPAVDVVSGGEILLGADASLSGGLTLAAGSTLGVSGATAVASSVTFPASGTVTLTNDGEAFPSGFYPILAKEGISVADVDGVLVPSVVDGATGTYVVSNNVLYLSVSRGGEALWTGFAGDGNLATAGNWLSGSVPANGDAAVINCQAAATLTNPAGAAFSPSVIIFPAECAALTITGDGITGITAITNLSDNTQTFECPVAFADRILVSQKAKGWGDSREQSSVRFAGGVTGTTFADGTARFLNGAYDLSTAEGWAADTHNDDTRWGIPQGSSLTVPSVSNTVELAIGQADSVAGGAFTAGVVRTSSRICCWNAGEYVVTNELAVTLGGDVKLAYSHSDGAFKFEKVTVGDRGASKWFYFGLSSSATGTKNVWIGAGGLTFADGTHADTGYSMGDNRDGELINVRPWYSDYTIATKPGSNHDIMIQKDVHFGTTDENGVPRTVTADGIFDRSGKMFVEGEGRFVVNAVNKLSGAVMVTNTVTLAINPGKKVTTGVLTVASGTTLEVAQSGTVVLGGGLTLADGAILGFNYTGSAAPVLDLSGKTVTFGSQSNVVVKVSAESHKRAKGGANVLTSGGKFTDVNVSLAPNSPDWVKDIEVNADGNIVITAKKLPLMILVR